MVAAVCWLKPSQIFDWGTNIGLYARIFYKTCKYFNLSSEIHSIDLPDDQFHVEHPGKRRGELVRELNEVQLHQGDGVSEALRVWKFSDNKETPLFFLDGDHSYESVKRELNLINKNVVNANFLIHDTFFQSKESGYNIGPFLAIQEFTDRTSTNFTKIDTKSGLPGMTLLYQKKEN